MPETAQRLKMITESVIREMSRLALQFDAINLAQGFPDFDPPEALIQAAERAMRTGVHQYSMTWGAERFRKALARKQTRFMGQEIDPEAHVTVTCGSTEAMLAALMTVCDPGDQVIIFSPFYENYAPDAILTGVVPVHVELSSPDYLLDVDALRAAFQKGVKALILCNPMNPTGRVFSREELGAIASLAQEFDAFVLTDEVYEHIVYAPHVHTYIASLPGMFERTLSCSSLSKTYAITGWRLGYVITSTEVTNEVRKVHDFTTLGAPAPLQEAAVTALDFPDSYYADLQTAYTRRRDILLPYLEGAGLAYSQPEGAYYTLVDIGDFGFPDDMEFCLWMAQDIGVVAVPGSSFFKEPNHRYVRLNFAKQEDTLHQAGERLLRLKEKL
jgi:aminotransferase